MKKIVSTSSEIKEPRSKGVLFDYNILSSGQLALVKQETIRIRRHLGSGVAHMLDVGVAFNNVKHVLPYGRFQGWLAAEFGWSARTAARYIAAAKLFGSRRHNILLDLELSVIYKLAASSTPRLLRSEIIAEIEQGRRPNLAEIRTRIQQAVKADLQSVSAEPTPDRRRGTREALAAAPRVQNGLSYAPASAAERAAALILQRLCVVDKQLLELLRHARRWESASA